MVMHKIGIIGVGNMGLAIIQGAIRSQVFSPKDFLAYSRNKARQTQVENLLGIDFTESLEEIAHCEQIILATKPQDIMEVLSLLVKYIPDHSLIVSIAAGISLKTLKQSLKGKGKIIRVMPNTPISIGQGVSALAIGEGCDQKEIAIVQKLFSSMGKTLIVKEDLFDVVSALSGSGPAYLFYFVESLIDAAVRQGLEKHVAHDLIIGTFSGAMQLLENADLEIPLLRKMVTSPKGSTAEAIKVFDKNHIFEIVHHAISAAVLRNKELGESLLRTDEGF
ncbi:MAG: pyrroline-5-carboxylate reductase [Parachlamydiales bacterium]|nr:pyrroline-5-carboxylate reductase [Parachlamydiales bacterium]